MVKHALLLSALVACTTFEDPDVVIDLRVIAMTAEPPDQIVDVDLMNPQMPAQLLEQIKPTEVCALVADVTERRLRWSMTICPIDDGRCYEPMTEIASGVLEDAPGPSNRMCATVQPDGNLLGILLDILNGDILRGLGGIDYGVQLRVGGEGADPALDQYAVKMVRIAPRIPASRTENHNPTLDRVDIEMNGEVVGQLPLNPCVDGVPSMLTVGPAEKVRLRPIEREGVREEYVVPLIDGTTRTFTESLTYQWLATGGGFSAGSTGGPHDPFGNPAPLFTEWKSPSSDDLAEGVNNFTIWIVQRDERLGSSWVETCVSAMR